MSLKVLIAHEAKERDSVFERTLKSPKFSLIYAESCQNGEEVAREILEKNPDIAVFDAVMSHADGLSVMERIRSSGKKILTIVLMSAHNQVMESELYLHHYRRTARLGWLVLHLLLICRPRRLALRRHQLRRAQPNLLGQRQCLGTCHHREEGQL